MSIRGILYNWIRAQPFLWRRVRSDAFADSRKPIFGSIQIRFLLWLRKVWRSDQWPVG